MAASVNTQNLQPANPASLYVGDLDQNVTEAILFEVFNSIGSVASIRVCRDTVTRRSLGYGYVNFLNVQDAEKAIEELNFCQIRGQPVRIMWSNRDPSMRKSGSGNIFIKNLDPSIDNKALHDTFSAFGNILSCKVAMEGEQSRGFGFVHYETREQALAAIEAVNGMLLNDRQVYVGLHVSKKERDSKIEEQKKHFTNVFVKNLDASVDQAKFLEMFSKFGPVTSCLLSVDEQGKSKEFGFVNYENHEDAFKCVEEMNGKEIVEGKPLYVGRAQKKAEREDGLRRQYERIREEKMSMYHGVNLYLKNLDDSMTEEKIREEFGVFGTITSCKIMQDEKNGDSKGFGFVCFSSPDESNKAIQEMNGRLINGKPLYVAMAQRKDDRQHYLASQIQQRNMRMQQSLMPGAPPVGYPGQPMFYPQQRPPFFQGQPPQMMGARPGQFPPNQPQMGVRPNFPVPPQGFHPQQTGGHQQRPQNRGGRQNNNVGRPQGMNQQPRGPMKYPNQQAARPQIPQLDLASLATLEPEQQKQVLGESLFPLVLKLAPENVGKLTGMLLEMDKGEVLHLLENPEALKARVSEGVAALEEAKAAMKSA